MTTFGFRDRQTAENLKVLGETMSFQRTGAVSRYSGLEVITVTVEDEIAGVAATGPDAEKWIKGSATKVDRALDGVKKGTGTKVIIYNTTADALAAGSEVTVVKEGDKWITITGGSGTSTPPPKRVRFRLTEPIKRDPGFADSGFADAVVIDPLNSNLSVTDILTVYDPRKEFTFAHTNSIGWATKGIVQTPSGDEEYWIIESCTQLVVRVKATLDGCLAPWLGQGQGGPTGGNTDAVPTVSAVTSESYWPYVMWLDGEQSEISDGIENPERFSAEGGTSVWLERRESDTISTQVPSGTVIPYDSPNPAFTWVITAVEEPTAKYAQLTHLGNGVWDLSGGHFDGFAPGECIIGAKAPDWFADTGSTFDWCPIPINTIGTGRLDTNTGNYVLIHTGSAFYGEGTKTRVVGEEMPASGSIGEDGLIYKPDSPGDCGKLKYKEYRNVIIFGNQDESSSCMLEQIDPDPELELAGEDIIVVTGVTTNAEGEMELETKTIKTMCEPEAAPPVPMSYVTQDVVTDVYCADGSVNKDYRQIKFIGSAGGETQGVALPCTNPENYNWETIFTNHIYNEDWWNVSYYDITYPTGCEPCGPTGCCTVTYQGDFLTSSDGITETDCTALESSSGGDNSTWVEGAESCPDAPSGCCFMTITAGGDMEHVMTETECSAVATAGTYEGTQIDDTAWTSGECGLCDCCTNMTMTNAYLGGITNYGSSYGSSLSFDFGSIQKVGDTCVWNVNGQYGGDWGYSASGSCTVSYDEATSTWSVSGTAPATAGGTFSGTLVVDSCTTPEVPDPIIIIPVTGTHVGGSGGPEAFSGGFNLVWDNTCT